MFVEALGATALYQHGPDGPGWWLVFPILWFLLVASAVTFFAVNIGRRGRRWGRRAGEHRLAERFASGEIDETEYRSRLAVLRESNS